MVKKYSIGNSVNRGMFNVDDSMTVRQAFETNGIVIEGNVTANGMVIDNYQLDEPIANLGTDVQYLRSIPAKQDAYDIKVLKEHAVLTSSRKFSDWKKVTPYSDPEKDDEKRIDAVVTVGDFPGISEYGVTFSDNGNDVADVQFDVEGTTDDEIKSYIFENYGNALRVLKMGEDNMDEVIADKKAVVDSVVRNVSIVG